MDKQVLGTSSVKGFPRTSWTNGIEKSSTSKPLMTILENLTPATPGFKTTSKRRETRSKRRFHLATPMTTGPRKKGKKLTTQLPNKMNLSKGLANYKSKILSMRVLWTSWSKGLSITSQFDQTRTPLELLKGTEGGSITATILMGGQDWRRPSLGSRRKRSMGKSHYGATTKGKIITYDWQTNSTILRNINRFRNNSWHHMCVKWLT